MFLQLFLSCIFCFTIFSPLCIYENFLSDNFVHNCVCHQTAAKETFGRTAIYFAAQNGKAEVVELLIERKASIDVPENGGTTALMAAVEADDAEQTKWRKRRVAELLDLYGIEVCLCASQLSVHPGRVLRTCACVSLGCTHAKYISKRIFQKAQ